MTQHSTKKFIRKPKNIIVILIIIGLIAGGVYFYFGRANKLIYNIVVAKRGDIIQEVSVTGRVKPAQNVDLAFEKIGRVARVYIEVGSKTKQGDILVTLENAELAAQLAQAEAAVESAKETLKQYQAALESQNAKLAELKRGARPEEIRVQEAKVDNAKISVEESKKNLIDKLKDSYTKSDDAVRNRTDQFFTNPRTPNLGLDSRLSLSDSQLRSDLINERLSIETTLTSWQTLLNSLNVSSNLTSYLDTAKKNLSQTTSFLDKAALAVNGLTPNTGLSQSTIDQWKSDVSTGRTNVNTAITNLSTAEEKLKTAEADLIITQNELILKQSGSAPEQITSQEAQVKQAEANISSQKAQIKQAEANALNIQAQIAKTVLRSPINGIVTKQETKVGEIVSSNAVVVSLISEAEFEIEANIPEADIAKAKIGDGAKVTLDAYGNEIIFEAKVTKIDPAETIVEGVSTYKTTLQFLQKDERIKSGMTANIDILTAKAENAIAIPQRAVFARNGGKFVKIKNGEDVLEVQIKTGLRGSDGNVEIIEGIKEGDRIVVSQLEK